LLLHANNLGFRALRPACVLVTSLRESAAIKRVQTVSTMLDFQGGSIQTFRTSCASAKAREYHVCALTGTGDALGLW
jgi:hypothetical protein